MIVGIIGCDGNMWSEEAAVWVNRRIGEVLKKDNPTRVVTGDTTGGGVNDWVDKMANTLSIPLTIVPLDKATAVYTTARDILIAQHCDKLVAIVARNYKPGYRGHRTLCRQCPKEVLVTNRHIKNPACWAMRYAEVSLKRQTQLIVVGR